MADKKETRNAEFYFDKLSSKLPDRRLLYNFAIFTDSGQEFHDEEAFLLWNITNIARRVLSDIAWLSGLAIQPGSYYDRILHTRLKEKELLGRLQKVIDDLVNLSTELDLARTVAERYDGPALLAVIKKAVNAFAASDKETSAILKAISKETKEEAEREKKNQYIG